MLVILKTPTQPACRHGPTAPPWAQALSPLLGGDRDSGWVSGEWWWGLVAGSRGSVVWDPAPGALTSGQGGWHQLLRSVSSWGEWQLRDGKEQKLSI